MPGETMEETPKQESQSNNLDRETGAANPDEEMIKVVNRKGAAKEIPRSEYEQKKRSRRKHEHRSVISFKTIFSIAFILLAMILSAYVALQIVQ